MGKNSPQKISIKQSIIHLGVYEWKKDLFGLDLNV